MDASDLMKHIGEQMLRSKDGAELLRLSEALANINGCDRLKWK